MNAALIVTTYRRPEALKLVLRSALQQHRVPEEILVADDGSGEETARCIETLAGKSPIPIRHIRQEDLGFRAAMIRNRAAAASTADYLIFIDGDMLLHPDFISDHLRFAQKGFFLQGGRVLLDPSATRNALKEGRLKFSFSSPGLGNRLNAWRFPALCRLFARPNRSMRGIRTCNFSLYRSDFFSVNGFDNRFVGWGREDSELAVRLYNNGMKRKNLKFCAVAYHLYHKESDRGPLPENDRRLLQSVENKTIRCEEGVEAYLHSKEVQR